MVDDKKTLETGLHCVCVWTQKSKKYDFVQN